MLSSTTNNMIASSLAQINVLLEKTADWDKDERYMATNDLCQLLSKDIKIDESMEAKICTAVLKQLDDASNDVQSVAVKCLAIITKKVQQNQIVEVCKKLIVQILDGKEALRDVYSIGLKTLIADVSDTMGPMICQHLSQKLILGISRKDSEAVQRECLDNMSDLLKRFGHHNSEYHNSIMTVVIEHLKSDKAVIRKRAIVCLGSLVVVASDALLNTLVQSFLQQIEEGSRLNTKISQQSTRTLVQAIGTMSRTVGYRLGKHLSRIVPMFLKCIGTSDDESLQNDGSNELREYCFPGIESFLLRCPKEASPFINQILTVSIEFMKYDPNYAYDDDEDDNDENADEDVEMDCDEDNDDDDNNIDDEYAGGSDDDDSSWKVRKAAVKVIQAIISTRTELLDSIYELCGKQLISRFKEREENVRLDIMACYAVFLSARPNSYHISTLFSSSSLLPSSSLSSSSTSSVVVVRSQQQQQQQQQNQLRHINKTVSLPLLISSTSAVVKASCVQLASPSLRSRSVAFSVLRQFTIALHGGLDTHLSRIIPLLQKGLEEKGNQTVKLDALMLYRSLLELHSPLVIQGSVKRLLPVITSILKEDITEWYKVVAETLRVINAMISIIRPVLPTNTGFDDSYPQLPEVMDQIYKAIISKFNALDIDYETKDCVIATMSKLLHYADDHLFCYNEHVFGVLKKRLDNETTRVPTLKGLIMIASSPLHIDLTAFLEEIAPDLSMLLRQSSRALKQQALYTIGALTITTTNTVLSPVVVTLLFTELSTVLSDVDIHLTHLALELIISIIKKDQDVSDAPLHAHIFSKLIILARSSLLQGQALTSLLSLYQHITEAKKMSTTNYNDLFNQLYLTSLTTTAVTSSSSRSSSSNNNNNTNSDLNKAGIANLSKCIACITIHSGHVMQTIEKLITDLSDLLNESTITTTTGAAAAAAVGVSTGGSPKKASSSNNYNTNNNDNNTNNSTNIISNHKIQLALLTIGEIGQQHDLSNMSQLNKLILKCFEDIHHSEDIKLAAAFCLGHIAVGNMNVFLPFILNTDRSSGRNQYLLLVSLKEILIIFSNNNINCEPYLSSILPILINQCNSEDDSVHTVVADCLGLLACLLPIVIFPSLLELITSNTSSGGSSKYGRYIAINAIRFSLAYATCSMETLIEINKNMKLLLPLLVSKGEELNVKKAMLQMVNTAIHHHTDVVREYISSSSSSSSSSKGEEEGVIVAALVETLKIKLERVVDLGPFKHRVDDNLPLRVVALTCIESILDNCPEALDYSLVMSIMPLLLAEKDEIQSKKAQQILMKLSIYSPSAVITSIDDLIPLLNKLLNPPVKKNVEGDTPMSMVEIDKVNDLIKSCLRTVVAVNAIEDISVVSRKWLDFFDRIKKDKKLNEMINSLDSDKTLDFYNV